MARRAPPTDVLFPGAEPAPPPPAGLHVGVALDLPLDHLFTYRVPDDLAPRAEPGRRAVVPFRGKSRTGFLVEVPAVAPAGKRALPLRDIPDEAPLLGPDLLDLGRSLARGYGSSLGEALAAMVPRGVRSGSGGRQVLRARLSPGTEAPRPDAEDGATPRARVLRLLARHPEGLLLADVLRGASVSESPVRTLARRGLVDLRRDRADPLAEAAEEPVPPDVPPPPSPPQAAAIAAVEAAVQASVGTGASAAFLLLGVTGSGKTEVYLRGIAASVAAGRQAIVLVPEIALTPQTVRRFRARFERVAVLHSGLGDAERARTWHRVRAGGADVVIGPRSAVFAPVPRLGLIVVDEEHEGSFKQQNPPRYHARDVALVRARAAGAVLVLGSATPCLESWRRAVEGRLGLLRLPERVGGRSLPSVQVVDLRSGEERGSGAGSHLSRTLEIRMREALREGGQVILLQNRRGFATSVACPRCGWVLSCRRCDLALTYHRSHASARCHLCGHEAVPPGACPDCGLPSLRFQGVGTQTVESEVAAKFPEARMARMDSDTMTSRGAYEEVLGRFGRREIDVLVGTQMIAKGLHFPHVTLVGIVSADTALVLPDFRSAERTFALVAQVAGRAGRGEAPGRVVVQTTMPDHPAILCAAAHDYEGFARAEMEDRRVHRYPPWTRLVRVVVRGLAPEAVERRIEETATRLRTEAADGVEVLGPAEPPLARVQGRTRRHLLAKCRGSAEVRAVLASLRAAPRPTGGVEEAWDVDPQSML